MNRPLAGIVIAVALTVSGCQDGGKAKPSKFSSPASGWIVAKTHTGDSYRITLKKNGKVRIIHVTAAAWNRCHVDRWYPSCK